MRVNESGNGPQYLANSFEAIQKLPFEIEKGISVIELQDKD